MTPLRNRLASLLGRLVASLGPPLPEQMLRALAARALIWLTLTPLILTSLLRASVGPAAAAADSPHATRQSSGAASSARGRHEVTSLRAEPGFHREIDNASVTVIRVRIPPRATIPEHDVSPRVVVWLTDAHLALHFPDGTTREERYRAGQVAWVTPERHAGENLNDREIEFVAVLPKHVPVAHP